jgi:hypothetical protein
MATSRSTVTIQEPEGGGWSEWFRPVHNHRGKIHREICCDCGLVHDMQYSVDTEGRVIFRAMRNPRATANARRHFKFKEKT